MKALPLDGMLEFDHDAAEALGVLTLLASGLPADTDLADALLAEMLAAPDGPRRVARGMASVSGGLLALLEFFGSVAAPDALQEFGRAMAEGIAYLRSQA